MSRVNLGNSDQYIEQAKATTWNINVGSFDVSKAISSLEFEDAISQPGNFTLDLVVDPGDINGGEEVTIDKEGVGAFNGVVTQPERSSQRDDTIKGGGAAELLSGIPINGEFLGTNTQSVVNNIFSQLDTTAIEVGLNEELSDGNGNVDVRAEDEGALNLLNRVVLSHGGDWYVTYDSQNDVYKFNVVNELSNSTSRTFGDEAIDELRDVQVIDEEYDAVVVKGYGDGDDQIIGEFPARNTWPDDPKILRYTDKTILSSEEANSTAENVYNEHTEWRNIYLYPANENELLSLGDEVEIDDSATGVNATFRVVQRKLHVSFSSPAAIEYVLSDRPIGVLDEGEDIREQTDSQTDYMQGSRNVWGEKETSNATNAEPLSIDFEVPQDVKDKKDENRVNKIKLNYSCDSYRSGAVNEDVRVSSTNLTKNNKMDSTSQSTSNKLDGVTDDEDPGVEEDNGVEVESGTQASIASIAAGGGSVITTSTNSREDIDPYDDSDGWSSFGMNLDAGTDDSAGAVAHCWVLVNIGSANFSSNTIVFAVDWQLRLTDENDNKYPDSDGIRFNTQHIIFENDGTKYASNATANLSIPIPVNTSSREYDFEIEATSSVTDTRISAEGDLWVYDEHVHDVEPDHTDSGGNLLSAPGSDGSVNVAIRDWVYDVDESSSSTVDNVSDNTSSTVDDVSDNTENTVVSVSEDIVAGNTANEVQIIVDGTDITNDVYGNSFSGINQDQEIDITQYLTDSNSDGKPDTGWHNVQIIPDSATYLKSRVFLDHKKDN